MMDLLSESIYAVDIRLHYYRLGNGEIPIVLAHGITDDGLCWMPVAKALAPKYSLFMLDMRGHGKSDAAKRGYTLENLALDMAALVRALRLAKPILLGHSMGALATLLFAGFYPDLPRAILLEDPPAFWKPGFPLREDVEFRSSLREWIIGLKRKTREEIIAEGRAANPGWSDEELEPWADSKHRFDLAITDLVYPADQGSIDYPTIFRRISCPAFLLSAEKKLGAASSEADIALLRDWMPQLKTTHFEGAGHSIRRDKFPQYMDTVQKVLQELG
jgi:N-formylmaleamate deformylase